MRSKIRTLVRLLSSPGKLPGRLIRVRRYALYGVPPAAIAPPAALDDVECIKLSDQDFGRLPAGFEVQVERFQRYGFSAAYAVLYKGQIAHINWLFLADQQRVRADRIFVLRPDEAEIAHGLTLPEFRGRGFQPYAIRYMSQEAVRLGVRRVLSIVNLNNGPSRRGLEKADFGRCGTIVRITSPLLKFRFIIRLPYLRPMRPRQGRGENLCVQEAVVQGHTPTEIGRSGV